jgi:short subunit dehydrogenase
VSPPTGVEGDRARDGTAVFRGMLLAAPDRRHPRACGILGTLSMMARRHEVGKTTFDFSGQVVAVTGGGKGIGKGSAIAFGEAGARVYVIDHTEVTGETTAKIVRERGGRATFLACDVTSSPRS